MTDSTSMTDNTIPRDRLEAGVVECPLCGRQIANPTDHLVVFGSVDPVNAATADAVECQVCGGVSFLRPGPDQTDRTDRTDKSGPAE